MAWGNVLVLGAQTTIGHAVAQARARNADFAVFRHGGNLFAFRLHELEAVAAPDRTALEVLDLAPWKKSWSVLTVAEKRPPLLADPTAPSSRRFVIVGNDGEPLRVEEPTAWGVPLAGPSNAARGGLAVDPAGTRPPPRHGEPGDWSPERSYRGSPTGIEPRPKGDLPVAGGASTHSRGPVIERLEDRDAMRSLERGDHAINEVDLETEGTQIVRYPVITASGERRAGATLLLRIDLAAARDDATTNDPIAFDDLPADWRKLPISVVVTSPQLGFADGANEGTILVRRNLSSIACIIPATVTADGEDRVDVTCVFSRDDRWCGTAQRTFTDEDDPETTGVVRVVGAAIAPDLTIHIHRDSLIAGRLHWLLSPMVAHRGLVDGDLRGETRLQGEPSAFVRSLFKACAGARPGEHVSVLRGIGETLWMHVPGSAQASYWKLRDRLGDGFSIQILTDEPSIPWELMRPVRPGTKGTRLLAETHPVARGLLAYPDRLRSRLPAGGVRLTIAPNYRQRKSPLPALPALDDAQDESATLKDRFHADAITPATARSLLQILEDRRGVPVQLLHFAGHGTFDGQALFSSIAFEDGDVRVAQVRSQEVVLGEKYKTFVILNACEVGATGDVLGDVGGWAEAFAYRDFSGFLAPLWGVFDGHARLAMEHFLAAVFEDKRRVGEALRDVRNDHGQASATFLSYVYYGDVNARFG
jgi:hypothetical protein